MSPEVALAFARRYRWELAWGAWVVGNLVWMEQTQDWISIPFHFIWVSFTVLYGFRGWPDALTWTLVGLVVVTTGLALTDAWADGSMSADEMFEVPLMFGMFLAMMLHTRRRKAALTALEAVSRENERMLEHERLFVQNASHALRSPLTVALAHAEMLQMTATDPSVREDLAVLIDEINRLRRLAERLLLLATSGAPTALHLEPTDLGALIDEAARRWNAVPRRWRMNRSAEATVLADRERLTLALDALIENSVKVTSDGGVIGLSLRCEGGAAVVEVSDDGPGIPPVMLESLFERFSHLWAGGGSGFGLGLSIVRAIIEMHGGAVTARNPPGGGAVLGFTLPIRDERRTHADIPAVATSSR